MPLILSLKKAAAAGISLRFIHVPLGEGLPLALRCWMLTADADGTLGLSSVYSQGCMADEAAGTLLASQPKPASAAGEAYLAAAADRLHAWWAGDGSALNDADKLFSKQLPGTDFEKSVWAAARRVQPGSCASYGDIAGVIGVPRGAQAVGNALRRNPVLLMTPCHRVLPASALEAAKRAKRLGGAPYETVGGFSGAMTGPLTDLKRHMLMWEAERFGSAEPALF